jgi:hypothetical protein
MFQEDYSQWEFYEEDEDLDDLDESYFKRLLPPNMFLDVSVAGEYIGRIEIELYPDCPKTVKNFRKICNGTK